MTVRSAFLATLVLLAGCSGGASLMPSTSAHVDAMRGDAGAASMQTEFRMTIPRPAGHAGLHPKTISPETQSVVISVNGKPNEFDTTVTSKRCAMTTAGLVCSFKVAVVPNSLNAFIVTTYSAAGGAGFALDRGMATVDITSQTKSVGITLGPVVSNANDTGPGSLRDAVANARAGDTIIYIAALPATIALRGGAIALTKNVVIAGPGASQLTVDAGGKSGIFTIAAGVTAIVSGLTLTNGKATSGGAILNGGNLTVAADVFTNNTSSASTTPRASTKPHRERPAVVAPAGNGGAINDNGAAGGTLTVLESSFTGNTAVFNSYSDEGGAIWNAYNFTLAVSDSVFKANSATYGGAVESDGPSTFDHDTFAQNSGSKGGSGYYAYGSGAAMHVDANTTIEACTFSKNVVGGATAGSSGYGGAVTIDGGTASTIDSSSFDGNLAGGGPSGGSYGYGGAIYSDQSTGGTIALDGDSFTGNAAMGSSYGYGGAIYSRDNIVGKTDTFSGNAAKGTASDGYGYAGAVYAENGLTLSNSQFTSNVALGSSGAGYGYGGAIYATAGVALTKVTFSQNRAAGSNGGGYSYGGAAYVYGAPSTFAGVTFAKNSVSAGGANSYAYGGGAYVSTSATYTNVTFAQNAASASGSKSYAYAGGLYQGANASISGTFTQNAATASNGASDAAGGALYVGATVSFTGTMTNNTTTSEGGGIYNGGTATIDKATIAGNIATSPLFIEAGGGGVYNVGTLTILNSTIDGNQVGGSRAGTGGAGIFNYTQTLTIENSTIGGNLSAVDGGGIENTSVATNRLINVTIYGNSATNNGGNVENLASGDYLSFANSIVAGGSATNGTDIDNNGTIASQDYNIVQTAVNGNPMSGTTTHNLMLDPMLLPLAANGGPTQTYADQTSGPGYDYIPLPVCTGLGITKDQRGQVRGDNNDNRCDVGAYENQTHVTTSRPKPHLRR